jgi:hypothetical protein
METDTDRIDDSDVLDDTDDVTAEEDSGKDNDFVESDSNEALEDESSASDEDDEDNEDIAKAISDGFDKVLKAINSDTKSCETGKGRYMKRNASKRVADEATAPKSADEILDDVKDNGVGYEDLIDNLSDAKDPDQPVGDNEDGGSAEPDYPVDSETDAPKTPKPDKPSEDTASTASVMRLVDSYIKAGVIAEANRFDAIERMSSMSKASVKNQLVAVKAVSKASAKRLAAVKASVKKTADLDWDYSNDNGADTYMAYASDGTFVGIITEGMYDQDGKWLATFTIPDHDPTTKFFDTLDEAKQYLSADQPALFASKHERKASAKKLVAAKASAKKACVSMTSDEDGTHVTIDGETTDFENTADALKFISEKAGKPEDDDKTAAFNAKRASALKAAKRIAENHNRIARAKTAAFEARKEARKPLKLASATPSFDTSIDMALI